MQNLNKFMYVISIYDTYIQTFKLTPQWKLKIKKNQNISIKLK